MLASSQFTGQIHLDGSGGSPWELEIAGWAPADVELEVTGPPGVEVPGPPGVDVTGSPGVGLGLFTRSRHRKVACRAPFSVGTSGGGERVPHPYVEVGPREGGTSVEGFGRHHRFDTRRCHPHVATEPP